MRITSQNIRPAVVHFHTQRRALVGFSATPTPTTRFSVLAQRFAAPNPPQLVVHEVLGVGTFAWVNRVTLNSAEIEHPEPMVAKFFKPPGPRGEPGEHQRHCTFEGAVGLSIDSPFVNKTYGYGEYREGTNEFPFILKAFVPGKNFYDWCISDADLGWDDFGHVSVFANMKAIEIARGLALGIRAFHEQGLLFIDLSIHNFMLDLLGNQIPQLHDLGSVSRMDTPSPHIAYDDDFTAPEIIDFLAVSQGSKSKRRQVKYWKRVGPAVDLYSLGQVFFHLNAEKPTAILHTLAQALTHRNPKKRPQSIDWVLQHL